MKKAIIITTAILVLLFAVGFTVLWFMGGSSQRKLSDYEYLKEPKISLKPAKKVLVVQNQGTPQKSLAVSFRVLFSAYYQLKGIPKNLNQAPIVRWAAQPESPQETWISYCALVLPDSVQAIPEIKDNSGFKPRLEIWEYGETAEILHIGSYDKEMPTITKLLEFIHAQGYVINGLHEEEYVKGPHPFFPSDPKNYLTVIRYPVCKTDSNTTR